MSNSSMYSSLSYTELEQLAQKIIEVIEMPAEQKKNITSFAKRRIIEEFNIKKQQQEFVEFYKN